MSDRFLSTKDRAAASHNHANQWSQGYQSIETPQQVYDKRLQALHDKLSQEVKISSGAEASANGTPAPTSIHRIAEYGYQMTKFEMNKNEFLKQEEEPYKQRVEEHYKKVFSDVLEFIGPETAEAFFRERSSHRLPSTASQQNGAPGTTTTWPDDQPMGPRAPTIQPQDPEQDNDDFGAADMANYENDQIDQHYHSEQNTRSSRPRGKRPAKSPPESSPPDKRPRAEERSELPRDQEPDLFTDNRFIEFDEVYQNGNAAVKYKIVRYPKKNGNWYIVECEQHRMHFVNSPLIGAAKHLHDSPDHEAVDRRHENAVRTLGTRVLNCDADKVTRNNAAAENAFANFVGIRSGWIRSDNKRTNGMRPPAAKPPVARQPQTESPGQNQRGDLFTRVPLNDIQPEQIFTMYWDLEYYPGMILPWGEFPLLNYKECLYESRLMESLPPCYLRDKQNPHRPLGWANGYGDGGFRVGGRKYPVVWFLGCKFPEFFSFSWVPAKNMYPYDPRDTRLREDFVHSVEDFLPRREIPREATVTPERHTPGHSSHDRHLPSRQNPDSMPPLSPIIEHGYSVESTQEHDPQPSIAVANSTDVDSDEDGDVEENDVGGNNEVDCDDDDIYDDSRASNNDVSHNSAASVDIPEAWGDDGDNYHHPSQIFQDPNEFFDPPYKRNHLGPIIEAEDEDEDIWTDDHVRHSAIRRTARRIEDDSDDDSEDEDGHDPIPDSNMGPDTPDNAEFNQDYQGIEEPSQKDPDLSNDARPSSADNISFEYDKQLLREASNHDERDGTAEPSSGDDSEDLMSKVYEDETIPAHQGVTGVQPLKTPVVPPAATPSRSLPTRNRTPHGRPWECD
ncbi:hypothetical protein FDECE_2176 [Fusarium decemcellulare]|nr:hypothetical protein FDECE_2176 [Fusarium decemcellulare]